MSVVRKNLIAAFLSVSMLAGCGTLREEEYEQEVRETSSLIANAAQLEAAGRYGETKSKARDAYHSTNPQGDSYISSGGFYQAANALALEAWATLANGNVSEARQLYEETFALLQANEQERNRVAAKQLEVARRWDAFGSAIVAAQDAWAQSASKSVLTWSALAAARQTLAGNLPRLDTPILFGESTIETDGIRMVVLPSAGPLLNIGKLVRMNSDGTGGSCTASLVGRQLALTNAHCVTAYPKATASVPRGRWPISINSKWTLQFDGFYYPDAVSVTRVHLHSNEGWEVKRDGDFENDWALLELQRHPAGRGYLSVAPDPLIPEDDGVRKVVIAGYSGDLNDGRFISMDYACPSRRSNSSRLLVYECRQAPGSSGSPVIVASGPGRLRVLVGVQAFGSSDHNRGGGPVSSQFFDRIASLRRAAE